MAVNLDKPARWKPDIAQSVDMYNAWFLRFAPQAFRTTRIQTTKDVEAALRSTGNMTDVKPITIRRNPDILPTLRMSTCPPLAVDRLIGLAGVPPRLVKCMEEKKKLPPRMPAADIDRELGKIGAIIEKMAAPDIFAWLGRKEPFKEAEVYRAATIVADRLCGAVANPIIRNASPGWTSGRLRDINQCYGLISAGTFPALFCPGGPNSIRMTSMVSGQSSPVQE
jgi:type II restriction enzyme